MDRGTHFEMAIRLQDSLVHQNEVDLREEHHPIQERTVPVSKPILQGIQEKQRLLHLRADLWT